MKLEFLKLKKRIKCNDSIGTCYQKRKSPLPKNGKYTSPCIPYCNVYLFWKDIHGLMENVITNLLLRPPRQIPWRYQPLLWQHWAERTHRPWSSASTKKGGNKRLNTGRRIISRLTKTRSNFGLWKAFYSCLWPGIVSNRESNRSNKQKCFV